MRRILAPAIALVLAAWVTAASAAPKAITMNFKDAEIEAVVQFISELTGRNFILDEKVRGKITVIAPGKVTPEEAYQVFQAILNVKGFTIAPVTDKVYKIVATREAKQTSIETMEEGAEPGERFVTRLLPLKFVQAETVAGILAPLVSKDSSVVAYAPTNTLILTDSLSNIERLVKIIDALDVKTVDTVFEVIPIRYAAAETLAKNLSQAVTQKGRTVRRRPTPRGKANVQVQAEQVSVKIIPDSRTNSLIVIADPQTLAEIKKMIQALDVEIPRGSGKINVYYLKYADAENVASVLTAISKSAGTKAKPGQPQVKRPKVTEVPVEFEEPVQITADKATNSLVIIASPRDYETLTAVIEKLDVRRPQVLVEAAILEMSYEKSLELGVEWRTVNDISRDQPNVFGGTNFGTITPLMQNPLNVPTGLFLGAVKGTITFNNQTFLNVGALIRALQKSGDVNVLSTPHILTTDNEEAEIVVSDNIPFQTSQKFDTNGNPIFTFEYRDVGLTLRITPQINDDDYVKLKLFQEISQIVSTTTGTSTNAPTTTRRSAKTTVVVKDQTTVVIGGLIKDNTQVNVSSVPCLGDIPFLGALFRTSSNANQKTNLLIFLTPHIIRTMDQITEITREKRATFDRGVMEHSGAPRKTAPAPEPTQP
ncbi:type II secretion system secretin GspD [Deferrisoma camini]|uniref:type II secretion system secretin GspD n=1 Tax=Deferrisoma camini TaxID=1035120 RepID=UPI00046CD89D|nr:type II secretion system secretin GspD [Deferrisoma camini]